MKFPYTGLPFVTITLNHHKRRISLTRPTLLLCL